MRKFLLFAAVLILGFTACSKDDPTAGQAQAFTDFRFTADAMGAGWNNDFVGTINPDNRTITFITQRWIENIAGLRATFTLAGNYEVRVGETLQASGVTENDFRQDIVYTIGDKTYTVRFVSPQATGLPVVRIDTRNSAPIDSRTNWTNMTHFALSDPNNPENDFSRTNISPSLDRIRGRGNSTWYAPKRPYRVRFRENVSLFGLPAAENWVLLANWYDATLGMRTSFAFELGRRLGVPHTPSFHHVELFLNGTHQGTYLLTEHRQVAPEGVEPGPGRVEIHPENGWLVEFDFRWHEEDEDPKFRTERFNLPLVVKGTAGTELSVADHTHTDHFVVNDWNRLADLMACSSFPENGYRELIDMEAIINFFLVQVIASNVDFFVGHDNRPEPGSVFFHKNSAGKIAAGPLWDFDLSFGYFISNTLNTNTSGWHANNPGLRLLGPEQRPLPTIPFFRRFFDDPVFEAMWVENWNNNREDIFSMVYFIDDMAVKLRRSATENYRIWRTNERVDFDWWVNGMRNYLVTRLAFLDRSYNSL